MKKLLFAALAALGLAAQAQAAPLYGYVQITTTTAITPTLQRGAINIASGTIRDVNVTYGVKAATGVFSGAVTASSFSPASALTALLGSTNTWTAGQTFSKQVTVSSNVIDGSSSQGTAGQSLQSNAGSAPTWVNVPSAILSATSTWTANQTVSSATITTLYASTATPTHIVGTTTNDNATAGTVGEYIFATVASSGTAATTHFSDLQSISLTAGDWDVEVHGIMDINTATWTQALIGISTTSGDNTTGMTFGVDFLRANWASSSTTPVDVPFLVRIRKSFSVTTPVYLKAGCSFSVGSAPQFSGIISARRVR